MSHGSRGRSGSSGLESRRRVSARIVLSLPSSIGQRAVEKLFPTPDPYIDDPVGWCHRKLGAYVWSKQRQIMESVRDYRFTAVPSCHGPGKSWSASAIAAWWIDVHPPGTAFVVTTAPTDAQVKAILWREIRRRHRQAAIMGRVTLEAKWYMGESSSDEELIGMGRKPQDYDADAFQGIHAKYVLVLVDEAGGVPKILFDALETLMTNEYARMLAIGNPDDPTSHFETICRPNSDWNVIRIPVWVTPNFTGEAIPASLAEDLVTPLWVNEREVKWGRGSPLWQAKVEAEFPKISNDTLFTPEMIQKAHALSKPGLEYGNYAWDIARYGADETVGYRNRGGVVRKVFNKHQQDTVTSANIIAAHLSMHGENYVPAVVDVVGVGAGVVDTLASLDFNVVPFNGGEAAFDNKRFRNRRAEVAWRTRELMENNEIDLDPFDEELAAQLSVLKWNIDRAGRIMIESKDDMRRRGLPSPDRADCVMMATGVLDGLDSSVPKVIMIPTVTGDLLRRTM